MKPEEKIRQQSSKETMIFFGSNMNFPLFKFTVNKPFSLDVRHFPRVAHPVFPVVA